MKKSIIIFFGLLLISCHVNDKYKDIVGEWKCCKWTVASTGQDKCKGDVVFNFKADKTYSSKIGSQEESGTYQIAEGILYSTPTGKLEIGVEINVLNKDSLQFTMSRSGDKEILTLLHQE
jgi:hypothetical protein